MVKKLKKYRPKRPKNGYEDLLLRPPLQRAIVEGKQKLTPLQDYLLPPAQLGLDILCEAGPGSGKTMTFVITILQNIDMDELESTPSSDQLQVICLCKSVARAINVGKIIKFYSRYFPNKPIVHTKLSDSTNILVTTPKRLKGMYDKIKNTNVSCIVINDSTTRRDIDVVKSLQPDQFMVFSSKPLLKRQKGRKVSTFLKSILKPPLVIYQQESTRVEDGLDLCIGDRWLQDEDEDDR